MTAPRRSPPDRHRLVTEVTGIGQGEGAERGIFTYSIQEPSVVSTPRVPGQVEYREAPINTTLNQLPEVS